MCSAVHSFENFIHEALVSPGEITHAEKKLLSFKYSPHGIKGGGWMMKKEAICVPALIPTERLLDVIYILN